MKRKESVKESEKTLRSHLKRQIANGRTYRDLASDFGQEITCGDIHRIVNQSEFPHINWAKRMALGLPKTQELPVCPEHGVVHQARCPSQRRKRKPPEPPIRDAVRKDFRDKLIKLKTEKRVLDSYDVIKLIETGGFRLVHYDYEAAKARATSSES